MSGVGFRARLAVAVYCAFSAVGLCSATPGCAVYDAGDLPSASSSPLGGLSGGAESGGANASGGTGTGGSGTGGSGTGGSGLGGTGTGGSGLGGAGTGGAVNGGAVSGGAAQTDSTAVLAASIAHRYSFNGSDAQLVDSVGSANGTLMSSTLTGSGNLELTGVDEQFGDLPNRIISSLNALTVEVWFTWNGGAPWQRVFDFGNSVEGEGLSGSGSSYLFLTPYSGDRRLQVAVRTVGGAGEVAVRAPSIALNQTVHAAVVVDESSSMMSLYVNGAFTSAVAFKEHMSAIDDANDWIGRSQFADAAFAGSVDELRVYRAALTARDIAASFAAGPNPAFLK